MIIILKSISTIMGNRGFDSINLDDNKGIEIIPSYKLVNPKNIIIPDAGNINKLIYKI